MRVEDFDYDLPRDLIAQEPVRRGESRLMVFERSSGRVSHGCVADLPDLLSSQDLVLLNDTRVIPARLYVRRPTGRRFEILLLEAKGVQQWEGLLRPSAKVRVGETLQLTDGGTVVPVERLGQGAWRLRFEPALELERLERLGEAPLPPYISRPHGATRADRDRYQTVYATAPGAVAAPTAGLHLSDELLQQMRQQGLELQMLTLHVGLGTFRPVAVGEISQHEMHEERYSVTEQAAAAINRALSQQRRIVCIGTTTVRALEGGLEAGDGALRSGTARTSIFITPGFELQGVGALLTNFHLPRSTLLMLVSTLTGREQALELYRQAVADRYRFYSYGDAMLIL